MEDDIAHRIVTFFLLCIAIGILVGLYVLVGPMLLRSLKNNAGHYSTGNILMMMAVVVGLYLLVSFLMFPKPVLTSPRLGRE